MLSEGESASPASQDQSAAKTRLRPAAMRPLLLPLLLALLPTAASQISISTQLLDELKLPLGLVREGGYLRIACASQNQGPIKILLKYDPDTTVLLNNRTDAKELTFDFPLGSDIGKYSNAASRWSDLTFKCADFAGFGETVVMKLKLKDNGPGLMISANSKTNCDKCTEGEVRLFRPGQAKTADQRSCHDPAVLTKEACDSRGESAAEFSVCTTEGKNIRSLCHSLGEAKTALYGVPADAITCPYANFTDLPLGQTLRLSHIAMANFTLPPDNVLKCTMTYKTAADAGPTPSSLPDLTSSGTLTLSADQQSLALFKVSPPRLSCHLEAGSGGAELLHWFAYVLYDGNAFGTTGPGVDCKDGSVTPDTDKACAASSPRWALNATTPMVRAGNGTDGAAYVCSETAAVCSLARASLAAANALPATSCNSTDPPGKLTTTTPSNVAHGPATASLLTALFALLPLALLR